MSKLTRFCKFIKGLNISAKLLLGLVIISVSTFIYTAIAAPPSSPYSLGETLAPTCSPGDPNCTVDTPQAGHAYLTDIAAITGNQGDIIYFDGSDWVDLTKGASGSFLYSNNSDIAWGNIVTSLDVDGTASISGDFTVTGDDVLFRPSTDATDAFIIASSGYTVGDDYGLFSIDTTNEQILIGDGTKALPIIAPLNNTDMGIHFSGSTIYFSINNWDHWFIDAGGMGSVDANRPLLRATNTTATTPNIHPNKSDTDTGLGSAAADQLSLIAGGLEGIRITEAASAITVGIDGTASISDNLTVGDDLLTTNIANGSVILKQENDAATPTLAFGDGDTGFYEGTDDLIYLSLGGVVKFYFRNIGIYSGVPNGGYLRQAAATSTSPALAFTNEIDTGIGLAGADTLSLIAGGMSGMQLGESGGSVYTYIGGDGVTATSSYTFAVDGTASFSDDFYVGDDLLFADISADTIYSSGSFETERLDVYGVASMSGLLNVNTNSSGYAIHLEENSGTEDFQIGVDSAGDLNIYNGTTLAMMIEDSTGWLGVNEADPSGLINAREDIDAATVFLFENLDTGTAAQTMIKVKNAASSGSAFAMGIRGTGSTTNGGLMQDSAYIYSGSDVSGGFNFLTLAAYPMRFYTGGYADSNLRMVLSATGNLGIGPETDDTPTYTLTVDGTASISGDTYIRSVAGVSDIDADADGKLYDASDIRLKKNVETIDNALEKLISLRGVSFNWKTPEEGNEYIRMDGDIVHMGFIAQEVASSSVSELAYVHGDDIHALRESEIIPLLVEAMKELKQEINNNNGLVVDDGGIEDFAQKWQANGALVFSEDVSFEGHVTFNADTVGRAKVEAGMSEVEVEFEKEYANPPIVTLTLLTDINLDRYIVADTRTTGFTIRINPIYEYLDIEFNWHAFGTKGTHPQVDDEPAEEESPVDEPAEDPIVPDPDPVIASEGSDPQVDEEPAEEPADEPVEEPVEEPAEEPIEEPVEEPIDEPVEEEPPVDEEPADEPVDEPEPELEPEPEPEPEHEE